MGRSHRHMTTPVGAASSGFARNGCSDSSRGLVVGLGDYEELESVVSDLSSPDQDYVFAKPRGEKKPGRSWRILSSKKNVSSRRPIRWDWNKNSALPNLEANHHTNNNIYKSVEPPPSSKPDSSNSSSSSNVRIILAEEERQEQSIGDSVTSAMIPRVYYPDREPATAGTHWLQNLRESVRAKEFEWHHARPTARIIHQPLHNPYYYSVQYQQQQQQRQEGQLKDNSMPSYSYYRYQPRPTEALQTTGMATAAAAAAGNSNSNSMTFLVKDYHHTPTNRESRAFASLRMDPQQQLQASLSIMASKNNKELNHNNNNNKSVSAALPATSKRMSPYFKSSVRMTARDAPLLAAVSASMLPGGRRGRMAPSKPFSKKQQQQLLLLPRQKKSYKSVQQMKRKARQSMLDLPLLQDDFIIDEEDEEYQNDVNDDDNNLPDDDDEEEERTNKNDNNILTAETIKALFVSTNIAGLQHAIVEVATQAAAAMAKDHAATKLVKKHTKDNKNNNDDSKNKKRVVRSLTLETLQLIKLEILLQTRLLQVLLLLQHDTHTDGDDHHHHNGRGPHPPAHRIASIHRRVARLWSLYGDHTLGLERHVQAALQLADRDPDAHKSFRLQARLCAKLGNYEQAVESLQRAILLLLLLQQQQQQQPPLPSNGTFLSNQSLHQSKRRYQMQKSMKQHHHHHHHHLNSNSNSSTAYKKKNLSTRTSMGEVASAQDRNPKADAIVTAKADARAMGDGNHVDDDYYYEDNIVSSTYGLALEGPEAAMMGPGMSNNNNTEMGTAATQQHHHHHNNININNELVAAHLELAYCLERQGDIRQAAWTLDICTHKSPVDPHLQATVLGKLGLLLEHLGDDEQAIVVLTKAHILCLQNAEHAMPQFQVLASLLQKTLVQVSCRITREHRQKARLSSSSSSSSSRALSALPSSPHLPTKEEEEAKEKISLSPYDNDTLSIFTYDNVVAYLQSLYSSAALGYYSGSDDDEEYETVSIPSSTSEEKKEEEEELVKVLRRQQIVAPPVSAKNEELVKGQQEQRPGSPPVVVGPENIIFREEKKKQELSSFEDEASMDLADFDKPKSLASPGRDLHNTTLSTAYSSDFNESSDEDEHLYFGDPATLDDSFQETELENEERSYDYYQDMEDNAASDFNFIPALPGRQVGGVFNFSLSRIPEESEVIISNSQGGSEHDSWFSDELLSPQDVSKDPGLAEQSSRQQQEEEEKQQIVATTVAHGMVLDSWSDSNDSSVKSSRSNNSGSKKKEKTDPINDLLQKHELSVLGSDDGSSTIKMHEPLFWMDSSSTEFSLGHSDAEEDQDDANQMPQNPQDTCEWLDHKKEDNIKHGVRWMGTSTSDCITPSGLALETASLEHKSTDSDSLSFATAEGRSSDYVDDESSSSRSSFESETTPVRQADENQFAPSTHFDRMNDEARHSYSFLVTIGESVGAAVNAVVTSFSNRHPDDDEPEYSESKSPAQPATLHPLAAATSESKSNTSSQQQKYVKAMMALGTVLAGMKSDSPLRRRHQPKPREFLQIFQGLESEPGTLEKIVQRLAEAQHRNLSREQLDSSISDYVDANSL